MANRLDVAARLADGRPAVEHTQSYVAACQLLGYQHPELTAHTSQVRDWYASEDGLDLRVLDDDCASLWAAVTATEDALRMQCAQLCELAAAWTGPAADFATQFLQRHTDAASMVAARVRAAAEGCGGLRDSLWQMVDGKVATAIAIDDRRLAQRPVWLAAAQTVTTGVGDRPVADEVIRQQVKPYVDNDIRTDWLTAMHSTVAAVAASYDAVTDGLTAAPVACFGVPGDLGPSYQPLPDEPVGPTVPVRPAPVVPAAATDAPPDPLSAATPAPATVGATPLDGLPGVPPLSGGPLGDAGGLSGGAGGLDGLGGLAGSIGGLVGKIIDGIGGVLGSLTDGLADPLDADDPLGSDDPLDADDPPDADDPLEADDRAEAKDGDAPEASPPQTDDVVDEPTTQELTTPPEDKPPAQPVPPAEPAPPAAPEAQSDAETPCEIAADELPQAGR